MNNVMMPHSVVPPNTTVTPTEKPFMSVSNNSLQPVTPNGATSSGTSGLETFEVTDFDPTSPASWEKLGHLWQATNGTVPTTEQLMQFIMMVQSGVSPVQIVAQAQMAWQQQQQQWAGAGGVNWQAGTADVPMPMQSEEIDAGNGWHGSSFEDTSALGQQPSPPSDVSPGLIGLGGGGGSSGGSMQRVGDKWVFVRAGAAVNS